MVLPIITIDGPSGVGKGTAAAILARDLNYYYLDSGKLFRAVAHTLGDRDPDEAQALAQAIQALPAINLQDPILRTDAVASLASKIALYPSVRNALYVYQRQILNALPAGKAGLVADGRDMGTYVYPEASYKFFLTAALEIRAQRRYRELVAANKDVTFDSILQSLHERDQRDQTRAHNPLAPASDALNIDTSTLSIAEVVAEIQHYLKKGNKFGQNGEE